MKVFFSISFSLLCSFSIVGQRVLIIGIDGCRADVAEIANTPYLDGLKANGIYSPDALNDDITISGPGWSAILCGVWSDKHLVTGNNFSGNNYAQYPSFFQRIEAFDSSLNTVSICHWSPINNSIVVDDADVVTNANSDLSVALEAAFHLDNNDPHAMFLHFDEIDGVGHGNGFAPDVPVYVAKIEEIDSYVGTVIKALESRPNYDQEDWIVILTSDHGGINFSHGGNTMEEENVPFFISGNSIPLQTITKDSVYTIDEAFNCLGDTSELKFDGNNDYVRIPHVPLFDFGSNQDFTVECRIKTNIAADVAIVGNKDWDSGLNKGFVFSFKFASGPEWKVNIGDGANRVDINTGGSIADGEWHTLSVSFDRDGQMRMYENGMFLSESSIASIGDITNGADLMFGTDINVAYDYNGSIAEVRLWDKVLSDQEIIDYACDAVTSSHPSYSNLIGYWKMNEAQGTQVDDQTTNANHGIISDAIWYSADSIWIYDYSNVPRVVDASINALGHLCIPIDPEWNLDGRGWLEDCNYNNINCINPGYNTWIGPANGLWNVDENWSRLFTPIECDNVLIPAGNFVTIANPGSYNCHSLKVETGGELLIEEGAELFVKEE
ncbi:MAG: LamG-like jellyroll fold domain-containing protein [Bacteroidota bacterium]